MSKAYQEQRRAEAKARGYDEEHDCTECGNRTLRNQGHQLICDTCGTEHDLNSNMGHAPEDRPLKNMPRP